MKETMARCAVASQLTELLRNSTNADKAEEPSPATKPKTKQAHQLGFFRVLIVEDDPFQQTALKEMFIAANRSNSVRGQ